MSNIPIKYILLEGCDASGKSTLYTTIHRLSKFKYNIQDRSFLSMLCYAKLYGRDESFYRDSLDEELHDANNFMVVLMPPKETILTRLAHRGDEYQNADSIVKLYDIFEEEVQKICAFPNVLVVKSTENTDFIGRAALKNINIYENFEPKLFGSLARLWAASSPNKEIQFRVNLNISTDHNDDSIMHDPLEGKYYTEILDKCISIIENEMLGNNPYGVPQDITSRRFIYSSDSCISSIHFLPRNGRLKVLCTLRSTDAVKNGSLDLRFLSHLSACVRRKFNWQCDNIDLKVSYNSLHIRHDK